MLLVSCHILIVKRAKRRICWIHYFCPEDSKVSHFSNSVTHFVNHSVIKTRIGIRKSSKLPLVSRAHVLKWNVFYAVHDKLFDGEVDSGSGKAEILCTLKFRDVKETQRVV